MKDSAAPPILEIIGASKHFKRRPTLAERILGAVGQAEPPRPLRAVENVSLTVRRGEVVGLVGESGCGKSTLARLATGLHKPTGGTIRYEGRDVAELKGRARLDYLLGVQMIFQDPYASLDPRMRVNRIISEALEVHRLVPRGEVAARVDRALAEVGLDPSSYRERYPHQFSGGQRQRIGIARALAVDPKFLVCDEPVAALDVSIQAQVINLFLDLRERFGLTYLFVSHDLGLVRHICERVAIMYLGRIVELGPTAELFAQPAHPYTQALVAGVPDVKRRKRKFEPIKGELPSPIDPPSGCPFHPRCPMAFEPCKTIRPELVPIAPGRSAACHLHSPAKAA